LLAPTRKLGAHPIFVIPEGNLRLSPCDAVVVPLQEMNTATNCNKYPELNLHDRCLTQNGKDKDAHEDIVVRAFALHPR
jgi:hypothetical protein